jgi:predicted transcriptional regulator/uncharacterized membrane protein
MVTILMLATVVLLLVMTASSSMGEGNDDGDWGSLSASSSTKDASVVGDLARFRLHARWGEAFADSGTVLAVEPMPQGWNYTVEGAQRSHKGYHLEDEGAVELTVVVDPGTKPGTYYLEPRIEHPLEPITLASVGLSLHVPTYGMSLSGTVSPGKGVVPNRGVVLDLTVGADAPVDRLVDVVFEFAPPTWRILPPQQRVLIQDGETESLTFSVTVADGTLPGDYTLVMATRVDDPRTEAVRHHLLVKVLPYSDLSMGPPPPAIDAHLGVTVTARVSVINRGNTPARVIGVVPADLGSLPAGWDLSAEGLPTLVPPSWVHTIDVDIRLPEDPAMAPAGPTQVPVRILTSVPSQDLETVLHVEVAESRDIWVVALDGNGDGTTKEAQSAYYTDLVVMDRGNGADLRRVELSTEFEAPITSAQLSQGTVMLTAGNQVEVTLRVQIGDEAAPGLYPVTVFATDGEGGEGTLTVAFRVLDASGALVGPLTVKAFVSDDDGTMDRSLNYVLTGYILHQGTSDLDYAQVDVYDVSDGDAQLLGSVPIENLTAGESRSYQFTLDSLDAGDHVVETQLTIPGGPAADPTASRLEHRFEAVPMSPTPTGTPFFFVMAVAVGALAGVVAILASEAGRFALMAALIVPLYTRLKPEQVTDHFVRGQILGYVKANPGETYSRIRKALKLSNGQFVYHARMLESQGHIRSVKDGANRRFYPAEMRIPTEVKDVRLNQVQRIIYTIILEYPGISQSKIAKMVKLAPSTVNYHVNIMSKVGVVERRRSGRLSLCFAVDEGE